MRFAGRTESHLVLSCGIFLDQPMKPSQVDNHLLFVVAFCLEIPFQPYFLCIFPFHSYYYFCRWEVPPFLVPLPMVFLLWACERLHPAQQARGECLEVGSCVMTKPASLLFAAGVSPVVCMSVPVSSSLLRWVKSKGALLWRIWVIQDWLSSSCVLALFHGCACLLLYV